MEDSTVAARLVIPLMTDWRVAESTRILEVVESKTAFLAGTVAVEAK